MSQERVTMKSLVTHSIVMSGFFAIAQASGFIARILFKLSLADEEYGIFAYFISLFQFFLVLNEFSLHVPIIATISSDPSNQIHYTKLRDQLLTTSFLSGILLSSVFILFSGYNTSHWLLAFIFGILLVFYSTSQILHSFPRGRDQMRPTAGSLIIVSTTRFFFLVLFFFILPQDLTTAVLVYALPFLGWWIAYIFYEGFPRIRKPEAEVILPFYKNGIIAYISPLGLQLPNLVGILVIASLYGFGPVGDFDIAMMPFLALTLAASGIPFVTMNKARKLPDFRKLLRIVAKNIALPLFLGAFTIGILALTFQDFASSIILTLGFPTVIFWPAVILVVFGIPPRILLQFISSYFHGRGVIVPIAIITLVCVILFIPVQIILATQFALEGVALGLALVYILLLIARIIYGVKYHKDPDSVIDKED